MSTIRDASVKLVFQRVSDTWLAKYLDLCANYLRRNHFVTGEELRLHCLEQGLEAPQHPNAWGAVFSRLQANEWLLPTNEWIKPHASASHSRQTRFWRSRIFVARDAEQAFVWTPPDELPSRAHAHK